MKKVLYLLLSFLAVGLVVSAGLEEFSTSDSFIQSLLAVKLGKSSTAYKTLSRIQNGAFELLSVIRRLRKPLAPMKSKLLNMLNVAAKANNTEKVHEIVGKLLFVIQSLETPTELSKISSKYAPLLGSSGPLARRLTTDPFDPVFNHLYVLGGWATLVFAIDDTGSMYENMIEAVTISKQIIAMERLGEVDYILSRFNDPDTGPVIYRASSERALFETDLDALVPHGGLDCPELAFTGIDNALNSFPQYGSSMFVFTDAAPKDGDDFTVQNVIDTASYWFDMKISFFLDERMCGSETEIDKYRRVAAETGGEVFTMDIPDPSGKRRKRRSTASSDYTAFVSSSLRGTSLVTSGSALGLRKSIKVSGRGLVNSHPFDIDDAISYVNVVVTVENSPTSITLSDPKGNNIAPSSTTKDAVIFEVESPIAGTWLLSVNEADAGKYNFKVSVAFKEPIDFDVKYLYEERPGVFTLIKRPLVGESQKLILNVVGGNKIDASTVKAWMVDREGNPINILSLENIGTNSSLKFSASFIPPNNPFRVRLIGKTNKGLNFERTTEQATSPAQIIFETVFAGDEFSANIGGEAERIMNVLIINKGITRTVTVKASAKYGTVTPAEQSRTIVKVQGFFFLSYTPPTDTSLKGLSDYVTLQASYETGEITTHRISILLL